MPAQGNKNKKTPEVYWPASRAYSVSSWTLRKIVADFSGMTPRLSPDLHVCLYTHAYTKGEHIKVLCLKTLGIFQGLNHSFKDASSAPGPGSRLTSWSLNKQVTQRCGESRDTQGRDRLRKDDVENRWERSTDYMPLSSSVTQV